MFAILLIDNTFLFKLESSVKNQCSILIRRFSINGIIETFIRILKDVVGDMGIISNEFYKTMKRHTKYGSELILKTKNIWKQN